METTIIREVTVQYRGRGRKAPNAIHSPNEAADFMRRILPDNSREHLLCLYLDGAHQVVAFSVIASGTATQCNVGAREIFQRAVLVGAVSFILGHNHPSGKVLPSTEDTLVTERLRKGGELLGIRLLDHVIVTDDETYSFEGNGKISG